jgi:hypothetical protein
LSSKPQQGASAALDEPFGVTATAADEAGTKVKSRQGVRPPNASESQILRELALVFFGVGYFLIDFFKLYEMVVFESVFSPQSDLRAELLWG